jgi:hypothetical protein
LPWRNALIAGAASFWSFLRARSVLTPSGTVPPGAAHQPGAWEALRGAAAQGAIVRTKDYWKGRPKLQAWYKSKADADTLRQHFERARLAGRTFARAPGGWVTEWLIPAASAASRGFFPAPGPEDDEFARALEVVRERYAFADAEEAKRRLIVLTARSLASGRDPFVGPVALAGQAEREAAGG